MGNGADESQHDRDLPAALLEAIAAPAGGRVVLILGAGCSLEQPTRLPLAGTLAESCYDELVANGVLVRDGNLDATDLSAVAEAVYEATGGQRAMVEQFPPDRFRNAEPNEGYKIAASLMLERALLAVLTLNFDLAAVTAVAAVGAREEVTVVEGPEDFSRLGSTNLVFLHRSITRDPEELILRTDQLDAVWQETRWEEVVAQRFLGGSTTVFVGLGTPAAVLIKTARKIIELLGADARIYVVDPARPDDSAFFAALGLGTETYLRMGWGEFTERLAERLAHAHQSELETVCRELTDEHGWTEEDVAPICNRMRGMGLLGAGRLRARLFMRTGSYARHPREAEGLRLLADLILGIALLARLTYRTPLIDEDGYIELESAEGSRTLILVFSAGGSRRWEAVETEANLRRRALGRRGRITRLALVAGVVGTRPQAVAPSNIASGPVDPASLVAPPDTLLVLSVDEVRANPGMAEEFVA